MLFQAEDMGMSVKEMITMTEGLTRKEVGFQKEQEMISSTATFITNVPHLEQI